MKLLLTLNEGVRSLGSRFDSYQLQVDKRFDNVNAELCLLKNRVDMIEQHSRRMAMLDESSKPPTTTPLQQPSTSNYHAQSDFGRRLIELDASS